MLPSERYRAIKLTTALGLLVYVTESDEDFASARESLRVFEAPHEVVVGVVLAESEEHAVAKVLIDQWQESKPG